MHVVLRARNFRKTHNIRIRVYGIRVCILERFFREDSEKELKVSLSYGSPGSSGFEWLYTASLVPLILH